MTQQRERMSDHQRQVASLTLHEHLEDLVHAAHDTQQAGATLCVELTAEGSYVRALASPQSCAGLTLEQASPDHLFIALPGTVGPHTTDQDITVAIEAWETPPPAETGGLPF